MFAATALWRYRLRALTRSRSSLAIMLGVGRYITRAASSKCLNTTRLGSLVFPGKHPKFGPGVANFEELREEGYAYFDRSSFIYQASKYKSVIFLRPRSFGKTLTMSTLECFHGVEYRDQFKTLFKDLDISKHVPSSIEPGKYLVMKFNFSSYGTGSPTKFLNGKIALGLSEFIDTYSPYLGESFFPAQWCSTNGNYPIDYLAQTPITALIYIVGEIDRYLREIQEKPKAGETNELVDVKGIYLLVEEYDTFVKDYIGPLGPISWKESDIAMLQSGFWAAVQKCTEFHQGIHRTFITGVTHLNQFTSDFDISMDLSLHQDASTMCGLTESEVLHTLQCICSDENKQTVQKMYNTRLAIWYFDNQHPEIWISEITESLETFLQTCADLPKVAVIEAALCKDEKGDYQKIMYNDIENISQDGSVSAWSSLITHMGSLTFDSDEPEKYLRIPNQIAAKRFGMALLTRLHLYHKMSDAVFYLSFSGNLKRVLSGYLRLIRQYKDFLMSKENYRDSICVAILENPALTKRYQLTKQSGREGYADLVIESEEFYTTVEFNNVQIFDLDLKAYNLPEKAKELSAMSLRKILDLELNKYEKGENNIEKWLGREAEPQLRSYVISDDMQEKVAPGKKFRAYTVTIIGSRQMLVREMDSKGNWVSDYELIQDPYVDGYELLDVEE